jgi:hypothetical protein
LVADLVLSISQMNEKDDSFPSAFIELLGDFLDLGLTI